MRYWWVNQNQTFDHELRGGYLWSPKRKVNNQRNPFYEFMREVSPGDLIFSFRNSLIPALGIAQSYCYESPKPLEFGAAGANWNNIGWKVEVKYFELTNQICPADHMDELVSFLPDKYSPLQQSGRGNQSVYLTTISNELAEAIVSLIGFEARQLLNGNIVRDEDYKEKTVQDILRWEDHIAQQIATEPDINDTEREALIMARRGQGTFKKNVRRLETCCRVTRVQRVEHLIASHCKPWRDCESHQERLDGENGLLLTPSIDHLFDRGFISFENDGRLLLSPVAHTESLRRMGIPVDEVHNVGRFANGQKQYLEFHRENVFLSVWKYE